jgi:hypothetical protein
VQVSGLAVSDEKNTEPVTDFSSISIPALAAACLMIAWVFWRGALIEVWNSSLSRFPSLARMPSGPFFQPASSRSALALAGSNAKVVFLETKR